MGMMEKKDCANGNKSNSNANNNHPEFTERDCEKPR
jgi:hypothetical protein